MYGELILATIALDAGHGGMDYGAVYEGRREKDDNLALTMLIGEKLKDASFDVVFTRTTDVYDSPLQKAQKANASGADFFVSIHRNAFPTPNTASGVETLVYDDSGIKAEVAENINAELAELGFKNLGVKERPNLVVLKRTNMPAVLVEAGFIDNEADNALFDANFDAVAQAIVDGIVNTLGGAEQPRLYKVQVGLFRLQRNAERLKEELAAEGFDSYIALEDGYYKVFSGVFENIDNARRQEQLLKDAGYATLIVG